MIVKQNRKRKIENNNRLHLIMAIVFLLAGAIIFRLYNLQFMKYDLYIALAADQHQVHSKLEPDRGRIFIKDSHEILSSKLYPIATNKEFALIYAIPKKINDPEGVAEELYKIFDLKKIEKEVDELLDNDPSFAPPTASSGTMDGEPSFVGNIESNVNISLSAQTGALADFRAVKRELEIESRKKNIIENYFKKLSRKNDPYEPIKYKVSESELNKINSLNIVGLDYIMESHRFYPENNIGAHVLGFVGFTDDKKCGQYGLEGFFNEELSGRLGSIRAERSANGDLIIINNREYNKPHHGSDLILTINRSIQFNVCKKLNEAVRRHGADSGSVIVMEPKTGAIIAMCSWPDYDPNNYNKVNDINIYNNPAVFNQYEPGSIFKVITMAAGIDHGKISPETVYNDHGQVKIEGWPKPIKNSDFDTRGGHGLVNMVTVLEESLNTGAIFAMQETGYEPFADYVKKFGFGEKTGIELETETAGDIRSLTRKTIRPVEAATASFGHGITITSLQVVTAYAAVANGGILMKPYLVEEIISSDGEKHKTQPKQIRRVISERTSLLVSGMMVNVVEGGHAKKAGVNGYYVAGKTGTAQVANKEKRGYSDKTIHTFVGFAPVEEPKFVMLVKLNDPKDVRYAASSAAPLFGEIAEVILNYYQVAKER